MKGSLLYAFLYKEFKTLKASKSVFFMSVFYTPFFIFFFTYFVYPFLVPPKALPDLYQSGLLFVITYPILVIAFMNIGTGIVLEYFFGVALKMRTLPISIGRELEGKMLTHALMSASTIIMGVAGLKLAAALRGVTFSLGMPGPVVLSILFFFLSSEALAFPIAAFTKGRIQVYNFLAVIFINVLPFISGMFLPLHLFPTWMQKVNSYNPFAAPYVLYNQVVFQGKAPSISYLFLLSLISLLLFWIGSYFYKKSRLA